MTVSIRNTADQFLSPGEIAALKQRSDLVGLRIVLVAWVTIGLALWLAASFPHPLVLLAAVVALGGQQLALAVAMHEGAHHSLFRTRWLNERVGQWLTAWPTLQDMLRYRRHHLSHHRFTGTAQDPDLRLASGFPVSRASFLRKLARDLGGVTGIKALIGSALMLGGVLKYNVSGAAERADLSQMSSGARLAMIVRGLYGTVLAQLAIVSVLYACGAAWLYLLWAAAWLTTFQLFLRIRSIAEHALTPDPLDALNNARTTRARWWERLLYAPLNVNYHLEHHMLVAVPHYQLPRMHALLRERGAFERPACLAGSYGEVLRGAVR